MYTGAVVPSVTLPATVYRTITTAAPFLSHPGFDGIQDDIKIRHTNVALSPLHTVTSIGSSTTTYVNTCDITMICELGYIGLE